MLDEFRQIKNEISKYDTSDQIEFFFYKNEYIKTYTDDTALTRNVCESLINCECLDLTDMAYRFQATFFKESNRGYTSGAINVFNKFKKIYSNNQLSQSFFLPAIELFSGEGI